MLSHGWWTEESVMVATLDSSNFQLACHMTWPGRFSYSMSNFSDDVNHQVFISRGKADRKKGKHLSAMLVLLPQQLNPPIWGSHFNGQPQLEETTACHGDHQLLTRVYNGPRAGERHSHLRTLNSSRHRNPTQPRTPPWPAPAAAPSPPPWAVAEAASSPVSTATPAAAAPCPARPPWAGPWPACPAARAPSASPAAARSAATPAACRRAAAGPSPAAPRPARPWSAAPAAGPPRAASPSLCSPRAAGPPAAGPPPAAPPAAPAGPPPAAETPLSHKATSWSLSVHSAF